MVWQTWIHLIYSREDYEKLMMFTRKKEYQDKYKISEGAIIKGKLNLDKDLGGSVGIEGKKSLILLTQSKIDHIYEDLISYDVIKSPYQVCLLDNLDASELEFTPKKILLKKATYLTEEDLAWYLDEITINDKFNNDLYQEDLELKSSGEHFMYSLSKIIILILDRLGEMKIDYIEDLFNTANLLYIGMGSWIFGMADGRIMYPLLRRFISLTNSFESETKNIDYIVNYVNAFSNNLVIFLNDQGWTDSEYEEEPTFNISKMDQGTVMIMCSIGSAINTFFMTSRTEDIPLPFELLRALMQSFDAFGRWLFATINESEIKHLILEIKKRLSSTYNNVYETAILEANNSYLALKKLFLSK
ncbi:MAG: hypothetical protein P8Y23_06560 [Candidatus Lokiarchaeota archaeon]|jgi:hypothetical protein